MTRLSLHGYGCLKELGLNPHSTTSYPGETWTATYCFLIFSSYYRKFEVLFISLSNEDYMHVKSSLKVQIKGSYSLKFFHIIFFSFYNSFGFA